MNSCWSAGSPAKVIMSALTKPIGRLVPGSAQLLVSLVVLRVLLARVRSQKPDESKQLAPVSSKSKNTAVKGGGGAGTLKTSKKGKGSDVEDPDVVHKLKKLSNK